MTTLIFEFHPEAVFEARDAYTWYASRSRKAADGFLASLEAAQDRVLSDPDMWPQHLAGTQICDLDRYPFGLVFLQLPTVIIGLAVAHHKRRPGYWRNRVSD